jgi:hypothetical protein
MRGQFEKLYSVHHKDAIAWLEKQGKQKSLWHNEDEEPQRGSLILLIMQSGTPIVAKIIEPNHTFNHGERWAYIDDLLEKQGKKPQGKSALEAAKEAGLLKKEAEYPSFDEAQGTPVITIDTYCKEHCRGFKETGKCYADGSCEAKIKAEQNSSWTEEDERNFQNIDSVLFREISLSEDECMRLRDWLQFLKQRATWKPTEEQIQALNEAVGIVGLFTPRGSYLKSLSEQLKKL